MMTEEEKQAEALSDRLRAWADLISSGYEVPAAAQTVLEAAEYINRSEASHPAVVDKLAAAMEKAITETMLQSVGHAAIEGLTDYGVKYLAHRFLANLAADLPDEMEDAAALAIADRDKWGDGIADSFTRAKALSDAELALTAALTVEPPRDDR